MRAPSWLTKPVFCARALRFRCRRKGARLFRFALFAPAFRAVSHTKQRFCIIRFVQSKVRLCALLRSRADARGLLLDKRQSSFLLKSKIYFVVNELYHKLKLKSRETYFHIFKNSTTRATMYGISLRSKGFSAFAPDIKSESAYISVV